MTTIEARNNNIIADFSTGKFTKVALGRKYGVSEKTIRRILTAIPTKKAVEPSTTKKVSNSPDTPATKEKKLAWFNEEIIENMLKYLQQKSGRLTKGLKTELQDYVVKAIENDATFFMLTQLEMLQPNEISAYVQQRSGEFYENFYTLGKENIINILKQHLKENS